jgi:hypothetical protein
LLNLESKELIDQYLESEDTEKSILKSRPEETEANIDLFSNNDSFDSAIPCIQTTPSIFHTAKNVQVTITKF